MLVILRVPGILRVLLVPNVLKIPGTLRIMLIIRVQVVLEILGTRAGYYFYSMTKECAYETIIREKLEKIKYC